MRGVERLRNAWRSLRAKGAASGLEASAVSRRRGERVHFGPFEADLHTHELWRDGTRIKLVGQPFVVLEMLLESPGDLITRDELRARLWPGDTFVSFDHGLNAAVNRLREALGDSATEPRYIETLTRRGYRFVAKVERRTIRGSPARVLVEPKKAARRPSRLAAGVRTMSGLFRDMRFAFRQLRTSPGFATVAVLTLALGIGASTVIFSIVYDGVLYPFPYRSAERLTAIMVEDTEGRGGRGRFPLSDVKALREGNHTFDDILAYGLWYVKYTKGNTAQMLKGVGATPEAKDFWGVPPLLGRWNGILYGGPRFAAIAFAACASLGFILAIVGLFSVMTYIVSLKTHDIGIRLALGASREAILQLVMKRGFAVIITGVVIGVAASLVLTRFVASQLTGVSATDPLTFVGVVLTVMLAGLFACFLPARRATLVEPMATLRNE